MVALAELAVNAFAAAVGEDVVKDFHARPAVELHQGNRSLHQRAEQQGPREYRGHTFLPVFGNPAAAGPCSQGEDDESPCGHIVQPGVH